MAVLGREVLSKPALRQEQVYVEEWDGEIILQALNEEDATAINKLRQRGPLTKNGEFEAEALARWRRRIFRLGWVDADGSRVLDEGDEGELAKLPFRIVDDLASRVLRLSGMAPGADGDAEKNSEATPG